MGCLRFKLEDFSPSQQARIRELLAPRRTIAPADTIQTKPRKPSLSSTGSVVGVNAKKVELADYSPTNVNRPPFVDSHGVPNKTESDYNNTVLNGKGRYEPIILKLPGGNYTPDWMTVDDGKITFHEVKGAYRFGSESRAVLAFKSAAAAFPFWQFVWAQKQKDGRWLQKLAMNVNEN